MMSRFICTSFSIATIGLASINGARADESLILQPRLKQPVANQPSRNAPDIGSPIATSALVVQPAKTPQTTSTLTTSLPPASSNGSRQALQSGISESVGKPDATIEVVRHPEVHVVQDTQLPAPAPANDSWKDSNGLTWVRRGSIEANKVADSNRQRHEFQSSHSADPSTSPSSIASNAQTGPTGQAHSQQYGQNALQGQATASAFSLAKAASPTTPVWLDANPANAAARGSSNSAKDESQKQVDDSRSKKLHLVSQVSKRRSAERVEPTKHLVLNGMSVTGPAAVEQQLSALIARSEQLCRRGMFLSAREESFSAMLQLSRYLDSLSNSLSSEPCMQAAKAAMREAEDFSDLMPLSSVQELAGSHETPVLKGVDLTRVPPASLAQLYYQHAESQLIEGSQQHPWFSDIFYSIGRTYQAEADSKADLGASPLRLQAVVYYRAATTIRPSHSLAANQLGFVLLQMDRPREAQLALVASVDSKLDLPALQNLAEASRRLGDHRMNQWAISMIGNLQRQSASTNQQPIPPVLEVDNRTFGQTTPIVPTRLNNTPTRTASASGTALR